MTETYEGRDTVQGGYEGDVQDARPGLDAAGIPAFIMKQRLPEKDRPQAALKSLEVQLLWGDTALSVANYDEPRPVTIGTSLKNEFRVAMPGLAVDRFTLADKAGDSDFVVNWVEGMACEVRTQQNELFDTNALVKRQLVKSSRVSGLPGGEKTVYQYKLNLHDKVAVRAGDLTFVLQYVAPARALKPGFLKTIDFYFTRVLGATFLAHMFLLLALMLGGGSGEQTEDDLLKNPNRFAKLVLKEIEKKPEKKKPQELSGSKGGGKHRGEEGHVGKETQKPKDALASKPGAPRVDPNKREKDRKIAFDSGILKVLGGQQAGSISSVFGPGGLGTGINSALGGLRGTDLGDAGGAGGLGTRGTGPGGGGNSLGIGGLGDGSGRGTGGLGEVDLGGRGKGKYSVTPGRTITKGCLTQEQVGRVIARHTSQIRYCYEKELQRNPNLAGKVVAGFVIGPSGDVMSSRVSDTTLGDSAVEQCILRVVDRMKFPPCAGGGTADVTYPWIFKAGGNE